MATEHLNSGKPMTPFTDDDLQWLKEKLENNLGEENIDWYKIGALIARLECAEAVIILAENGKWYKEACTLALRAWKASKGSEREGGE